MATYQIVREVTYREVYSFAATSEQSALDMYGEEHLVARSELSVESEKVRVMFHEAVAHARLQIDCHSCGDVIGVEGVAQGEFIECAKCSADIRVVEAQ